MPYYIDDVTTNALAERGMMISNGLSITITACGGSIKFSADHHDGIVRNSHSAMDLAEKNLDRIGASPISYFSYM